jgi:hypothetical protein
MNWTEETRRVLELDETVEVAPFGLFVSDLRTEETDSSDTSTAVLRYAFPVCDRRTVTFPAKTLLRAKAPNTGSFAD